MFDAFMNAPLWLRIIVVSGLLVTTLSSSLKNIFVNKHYSIASIQLIIFIVLIVGVINSLIGVNFKLF